MTPEPFDLSHLHDPVLVNEVLSYLLPLGAETEGLVVDGTVGAGGHACAVLESAPRARLLAFDRDPFALDVARRRLEPFGERVTFVHASYAELGETLAERGLPRPVGVLIDLGVSSMQLDRTERGFTFRDADALPDMRFDGGSDEATAAEWLNHESEREIARVLFEYGDEPRSRAVARAIVRARPIRSVGQLADLIRQNAFRGRRHDPAARSFQAIRIAVNDELGHVERGLTAALDALAPEGRLVVLAFHSGEERLVKDAFRTARRGGRGTVLTKKPVRGTEEEFRRNPRAKPARLRAFARAEE